MNLNQSIHKKTWKLFHTENDRKSFEEGRFRNQIKFMSTCKKSMARKIKITTTREYLTKGKAHLKME